jgi:hypothetical protein
VARSGVFVLLLLSGLPYAFAGAWGFSPFENDDALDWVADLEETSGPQYLADTFLQIDAKAKYIEAPDCSFALAAAEVVAATRGHPTTTIPPEVSRWVKRVQPTVSDDLVAAARSAVATCRDGRNSELRELWQDSKDAKSWLEDTDNLLRRLK